MRLKKRGLVLLKANKSSIVPTKKLSIMRHGKKKRKSLNMQRDHRHALLRNLATSIILFEGVKTTSARAKQVQPIVEDLITKAKTKETMTAIRQIKEVVFDENGKKAP